MCLRSRMADGLWCTIMAGQLPSLYRYRTVCTGTHDFPECSRTDSQMAGQKLGRHSLEAEEISLTEEMHQLHSVPAWSTASAFPRCHATTLAMTDAAAAVSQFLRIGCQCTDTGKAPLKEGCSCCTLGAHHNSTSHHIAFHRLAPSRHAGVTSINGCCDF